MNNNTIKTAFFGTPEISVYFLDKLKKLGFNFDTFITNPDAKVGRKKILTESKVSIWVKENYPKNSKIILKPKKIDNNFVNILKKEKYDFFFVLAYGKILPKEILDLSKLGTINLHPSILPAYRGPSPIMSAILDDQKETGLSLILLDEKMDHGPIIIQEEVKITEWEKNSKMEEFFAEKGAEKFKEILDDFLNKKITPKEQVHQKATFCKKYIKSDMELEFPITEKNSRKNFLKYCAFQKPFFFDKNKKRNIITKANFNQENKTFVIEKIIPEGKKERNFCEKDFL